MVKSIKKNVIMSALSEITKEYTEQEELVNDMMMLIASFSGRLYSARAKENAKKRKENKNEQ
jgi:predicted site-specific integrase-resolvase